MGCKGARAHTIKRCRCKIATNTFSSQSGELLNNVFPHEADMLVTDLQWSSDRTYFITACKDKTAKVLIACR